MTRGLRNNNPLNIRKTSINWKGEVRENTDGEFEQFNTIEDGIRAAFVNLRTHLRQDRHHLSRTTVAKEIERWAPPSENNTKQYVKLVCEKTNLKEDTILRFEDKNIICRLLWGMAFVENGITIPFHLFERVYALL